MKNFVKLIKSSIYDPGFYKSLESKNISSALIYFTKLNVVAALMLSIGLSATIIPVVFLVTNRSNINKVIEFFPAELEVQIKDGQAYSNISGPYIIPIQSKIVDQKSEKIIQKNLITIDTTNEFNLDKFKTSDSMAYLSRDYLVYQENGGLIRIQPLKSIGNLVISKEIVSHWLTSTIPYVRSLLPVAVVFLIAVSFVCLFIINIIFISIVSLVVLVVEKIRKIDVNFGSIFKKSLHLVTAIIILDLTLFIFHLGSIWLANIILFMWLYYSNNKTNSK